MIKPNSSFPVFTVEKIDEAKAFYSNHFGFGVAFENEWYLHLVSESGIQVGFLLPNQPTQPKIFHKSFEGALCDKHWDDIDTEKKLELKKKIG
ncbi:hypothetical protein IIA29_02035 [candidate division KSB1 bacterium]|nr:hypothetical protein [candidate division KSB1 bacterium]